MADLQAEVQAAAGELVAAGTETGLQVAVLRHGRVLADVVSGVADLQTAQPVSPGTLFYAASAAKGVAASLAHSLAVAFTGTDEVMGFPASWAFGYSPDRPGGVPSRRGSTFGMIGANGSAAYADIDSGLAVAVMRNGPPAAGLAAVARIDRLIAETEEHQ
jgi:CubicO group peptidase (beta-lactamase class C family)